MTEKQPMTILRALTNPRGWAYGLFWSWNLIFLAFMFLGFAPRLLPEMIRAVRNGEIPAAFMVYAILLTAIPALAVLLGLTVLRRSPGRLLTLGYGVEGPLMLVLAIRFFIVREATPAVALLLGVAALGLVTLLWQILDQKIDRRRPWLAHVRAIGLTLALLAGLYASAWIAFYAAPVAGLGWTSIGDLLGSVPEWRWLLLWILGAMLSVYTATLFVAMPIAVPILYTRAWWRGVRALAARHGPLRPILLTAAVVGACAVSFVLTNRQPQQQAFALLETPPATPAQAQALLDRQETIRAGLLNAYLAPTRYVSAVGEVRHVSAMYEEVFDVPPERAVKVQRLYETVARPVLYVPVHPPKPGGLAEGRALVAEPLEAAKLYQTFFDRPIVEGERAAIVRAVRSTWSIDQAQTAWQAVDDREVHLVSQDVTVAEHGDWAEVELHEVYQNQTAQRQEVVYYFSLPESAVVTGLWLGNSPDRDARFSYHVAPRGAAQALYRSELRRNRDPALVEQIGPRQYRLRVFPVEPQQWRWDETAGRSLVEAAPPLHMWLTWRVLAGEDGWPLARLAERRNVYWDEASLRLVNGEPMAVTGEDWLPPSAPATSPVVPVAHRIDFPNGQSVIARPVSAGDLAGLPRNLRLAVVLDRSRSMADHAADVKAALERLDEELGPGATVDVYLTASKFRGEAPGRIGLAALDPDTLMYFGGQNAAELLIQFQTLHADRDYDAILVLTDGSGYELGAGDVQVPLPDAPVWMVHLGGDLPLGYDDGTLEAIQASGGGVTGDIQEALARAALGLARRPGVAEAAGSASSKDVIDGYAWLTVPTEMASAADPDAVGAASDGFAALAARRLILAAMERQRGALARPEVLDRLHAIATQQSIVTPYSSMIVLVNQRQEDLLEELEAQADRFQREAEAVGETTPQSPFSVTGVPEPEEWLLLALAAGMLIWYVRTQRHTRIIH